MGSNELHNAPETDLAPPVNGKQEAEPELNAAPLNEEESEDVALTDASPKEEPALEEVPSPCPAVVMFTAAASLCGTAIHLRLTQEC